MIHPDFEDDEYRRCFECEQMVHSEQGKSCVHCDEFVCEGCQEEHDKSRSHLEALKTNE